MHSTVSAGAAPAHSPAEARLRTAGIAGLGIALPDRVVENGPIAERLGIEEGWIVARTGVEQRRHASSEDTLEALATAAGRAALEQAGVDAADLDQVLVGTFTTTRLLPNAAPVVADQLGAAGAGAIDIGAACTGWVSGLALATAQIEVGRADAILVIGADLCSRLLDRDDRRTAALFGDGAGAVLVTADGPGRIGRILLRSDGSGAECITVGHEDRVVEMAGQDTFRAAVTRLSESTTEVLAAEGLTLDDIDLFVYHQANARIIRAVGERLGLPDDRVVNCIARYGNTSAASIPIALADAESNGRLHSGARVLVSAFAAGFTWGSGVIEWGI